MDSVGREEGVWAQCDEDTSLTMTRRLDCILLKSSLGLSTGSVEDI